MSKNFEAWWNDVREGESLSPGTESWDPRRADPIGGELRAVAEAAWEAGRASLGLAETSQALEQAHGGPWGEAPGAPVQDWLHEVASGATRHGYWEWAARRQDTPEPEPVDEGPSPWFQNRYRCPNDGAIWEDEWSTTHSDRCPVCNAETEPEETIEISR